MCWVFGWILIINCFVKCFSLLRDNSLELNNVAARLEQQQATVETSNTQPSVDSSNTTDDNVT